MNYIPGVAAPLGGNSLGSFDRQILWRKADGALLVTWQGVGVFFSLI